MPTRLLFKQILFCLMLILNKMLSILSLPNTLMIGSILLDEHDSAQNVEIEKSLKFTIDRINTDRTILPDTILSYDIQYAAKHNSFDVCKKVCLQIQKGARVILGPSPFYLNRYVHSICDALDIPHIELHVNRRGKVMKRMSINLYPTQEDINAALLDFIHHFNWTKIGVLYEKDYGIISYHNVDYTDLDVDIQYFQTHSYMEILERFKDRETYNIIVDVNPENIPVILKAIVNLQMNEYKYHYFIMSFDITTYDLEELRYHSVNVTSFRLINTDDMGVKDIVKRMGMFEWNETTRNNNESVHGVSKFIKEQTIQTIQAFIYDSVCVFAIGLQALSQAHDQITANISCDRDKAWDSGYSLINYINSVEWKGITGPIKFNSGKREHFKMNLVKLKQNSVVKIGEWTPQTQLNIVNDSDSYETDKINATLVVIAILEKPYVMMHYEKNFTGNERFYGFCVDVLQRIASNVGFDYILDLVPDRKYGAKDPFTGKWNGMVAQLMKYKADLAVGSMTITYARENVIDFTKPFMNLGIGILFKVLKPTPQRLFSFMNPLAVEIWLYVVASYLVVSITIFFLNKHARCYDNNEITIQTNRLFTISNSFWFPIGTLMQQGNDINAKTVATRIVSAIWWFFTLIIIASYTANLAAFLTVERMSTPIENAEDLASQTEIQYGTLESGSTMTFFRDSIIETYRKMWRSMESRSPTVFTTSYQQGVERVLQGNYAFLMESTMIDYEMERNCNLTQIGGLLDTKGYGIATPKNSPWRDKISLAILDLQGRGEIQLLYDKWWKSTSTKCLRKSQNKQSKANALGMENIGGIFIVLLVGLIVGFTVAILELKQNYHDFDISQTRSFWDVLCSEFQNIFKSTNFRQRSLFRAKCASCQQQDINPIKVQ